MSDWSANTNKRLHFARIQLNAWESAEHQEAPAFREGFLLQLQLAWRSLLAEILESYRVSCDVAPSFTEALSLIREKGEAASEFTQLEALLDNGWLKQLEVYWQNLFIPYQYEGLPQGNGLIQWVNQEGEGNDAILTVDGGKDGLKRFKDLVGHFRNFNLEW
ncbi:hypothetical protein NX722_10365 [Endozoicomonas gorgoniicola]|uniref:Uncharacterized protein n=1 Tax=Endozoicomonas gorgoniicola TaxID=1234144 RepID=A0ABT3MUH3_9GAMM|nr:DUF6586 family protein [Endozoicomonas gorgoniicola]MCW7553035.1 hypothetical protein [Endozoicomonas gorgoniicola]